MLLLGKAHIGEVQASVWDGETIAACQDAGVILPVKTGMGLAQTKCFALAKPCRRGDSTRPEEGKWDPPGMNAGWEQKAPYRRGAGERVGRRDHRGVPGRGVILL